MKEKLIRSFKNRAYLVILLAVVFLMGSDVIYRYLIPWIVNG